MVKSCEHSDYAMQYSFMVLQVRQDLTAMQKRIEQLNEGGRTAHGSGVLTALKTQLVTATQASSVKP